MTTATVSIGGKRRGPKHGTESEYRRGCRCDKCRKASTKARELRRAKRLLEQEAQELDARIERVKSLPPEAGAVADLDAGTWAQYLEARKAREAAEIEAKRLELEVKERMGAATRLRVDGRIVATWNALTIPEHVRPEVTTRRFVVVSHSAMPKWWRK